ncbi:MAG: NADH-quinone oxidoreductase subunit D, partial [Phycisphaerae bacterium]|nr:NADH-quinone oxidoreductase subunit D [Phycisphaerae bacterium]
DYGPLQGALNLAVTNTIGAFLTLGGIALLYAQTGALNMAEIGQSLTTHPAGNHFLLLAFLFVVAGFLVKAAAVPFHFWLADAHAVAPTPVCILFSGVMVELGLYATARVYWMVFASALGPSHAVRMLLLTIGVLTAVVGAVECPGQRHLKRLLAFSTISHMGIMFCGIAMLDGDGMAGTAMYLLGHGLIKGSLFACAGILLHRFEEVDEHDLHGVGRDMPYTGILVAIGALGLAGLPPFGNFFGTAMIEDAAREHYPWMPWLIIFASAMTAGAVLRLAARVFLGWGERMPTADTGSESLPPERESGSESDHTPALMWCAAAALLLFSLLVCTPTPFRESIVKHVERFQQPTEFAATVLKGESMPSVTPHHVPALPPVCHALIAVVLAVLLTARALWPHRPSWVFGEISRFTLRIAREPLRGLHSGRVGDYVAWFIFGIAAYGGLLLLVRP